LGQHLWEFIPKLILKLTHHNKQRFITNNDKTHCIVTHFTCPFYGKWRVIGKWRVPQLKIIEKDSFFARAFPDGVILSKGLLNIVDNSGYETDKNDAILAFILGHELTHIVKEHFTNQQIICSVLEKSLSTRHNWRLFFWQTDQESTVVDDGRKEHERLADQYGLLYAAVAGFQINALNDRENFFKYWAKATRVYPTWEKRLADIQKVIAKVRQQLTYWQVATYLQHFKYPETAISFLVNTIAINCRAYCRAKVL